jgi:N-acetylmuramoyl-L-alanine amidase
MENQTNPDRPLEEEIKTQVSPINKERPRPYSSLRMIQSVILVAVTMATLFTFWNPHSFFSSQNSIALLPTPANADNTSSAKNQIRIGIQIGHYKHNDGFVCPDGIKEVDVDYVVANKVSLLLGASQIGTEVMNEYDLNLLNYKADALISIHTRSCTDSSAAASGFTLGTSISAKETEKTNTLTACLAEQYSYNTGLVFNYLVIQDDQINSHTFLDINPQTPAVQIEAGSLAVDRGILLEGSDRAANGITAGILCYLKSQGLVN